MNIDKKGKKIKKRFIEVEWVRIKKYYMATIL